MSRIPLIIGALVFICATALAQDTCQLVDQEGEPVAYAHVFLPTVQRGTLTDEAGHFSLPWTELADSTRLVFSSLNYQALETSVGQVRKDSGTDCTVEVRATPYAIAEVAVRAERIDFTTKTLGVPPPGRFSRTGYNHSGRGTERGVAIENKGRCRLRDINLFVSNVNIDSFRVELNLYAYADGSIGEPLQRERIFATISDSDANSSFQVPMAERNLFIDGPFLASVMMLDDHSDVVTMLEASLKKKHKGYRHHADGRWTPQEMSPSISVVMECPE